MDFENNIIKRGKSFYFVFIFGTLTEDIFFISDSPCHLQQERGGGKIIEKLCGMVISLLKIEEACVWYTNVLHKCVLWKNTSATAECSQS